MNLSEKVSDLSVLRLQCKHTHVSVDDLNRSDNGRLGKFEGETIYSGFQGVALISVQSQHRSQSDLGQVGLNAVRAGASVQVFLPYIPFQGQMISKAIHRWSYKQNDMGVTPCCFDPGFRSS